MNTGGQTVVSRRAYSFAVCALLLAALRFDLVCCQLAFIQQNSAVNPFQGQATAPKGELDQKVSVYVVLNRLLEVDDNSYSFKVNLWWGMIWQDDRAEELISSNTLSDPTYICQAWCSTEQGLDALVAERSNNTSDSTHQGLCCDNVYVPGAVAQNVIGYDVQSLPVQYQLSTLANGTVSYRVQVQGDFSANYNFKSYPFDRHKLAINIQTQFHPQALQDGTRNGADFLVLYAQNFGQTLDDSGATKPLSVDVYNSAELSQGQAWQIDSLELQVMDYTESILNNKSMPKSQAQTTDINTHSVRFIISISRTSKGFYALMIIVPISLIILFSFVIFVLPVTQIKGRMNIMATLFLTLIVLQFVLEGIMPSSYTLIPPYYLLLVSYIYIFGMVGLAILTNSLATQWQRRSARIGRTEARRKFTTWIENLPPPPPDSKLRFGHLPTHHHNPMLDGRVLAKILSRRFGSGREKTPGDANPSSTSGKPANGVMNHEMPHAHPAPHSPFTMTTPVIREESPEEPGFAVVSDEEEEEFESVNGGEAEEKNRTPIQKQKSRPWTMKQRSSIMTFLLRNKRIRWWSMWWYFIGRPESKEYCEYCAMKLERWVLPVVFVSYAAVVSIIFGVAQSNSTKNVDRFAA